jgi:hypothetical protein
MVLLVVTECKSPRGWPAALLCALKVRPRVCGRFIYIIKQFDFATNGLSPCPFLQQMLPSGPFSIVLFLPMFLSPGRGIDISRWPRAQAFAAPPTSSGQDRGDNE